jgi:preprotein translocase subunit Sec63
MTKNKLGQRVKTAGLKSVKFAKENKVLIISLVILAGFGYLKSLEEEHSSEQFIQDNLYALMGLPNKAAIKDVRKQYQKLSMQFHPDKNPDCKDCSQKMSEITKAYNVLSNQESKDEYDKNSTVLKKFNTKCQRLSN